MDAKETVNIEEETDAVLFENFREYDILKSVKRALDPRVDSALKYVKFLWKAAI